MLQASPQFLSLVANLTPQRRLKLCSYATKLDLIEFSSYVQPLSIQQPLLETHLMWLQYLTSIMPCHTLLGSAMDDEYNSILKNATQLKGFHQRYGYDYTEAFSSVFNPCNCHNYIDSFTLQRLATKTGQNNAFLNGTLEEEVFESTSQL